MTQSRKIAILYAFAVPAVLAAVFFERITLLKVGSVEGSMAQTGDVLHSCDTVASALKDSALPPELGNLPGMVSHQGSITQLSIALDRLREGAGSEPPAAAQFRTIDLLISERAALLKSITDAKSQGKPLPNVAGTQARDQKLVDGIAKAVGDIRTAHQIGLQQQGDTGAQSIRSASAAVLYGGFLTAWLIGVAAVLLFHDERTRNWKGVERRVHTRVLQELPIAVCVATDGGTVLYSNRAEEGILGYEPGELIGKDVTKVVGPTDADPAFEGVIDRLNPNQTWSGELLLLKRDSSMLEVASWVTNLDVAGKYFRVYVHDPYSHGPHAKQSGEPILEPAIGMNGS